MTDDVFGSDGLLLRSDKGMDLLLETSVNWHLFVVEFCDGLAWTDANLVELEESLVACEVIIRAFGVVRALLTEQVLFTICAVAEVHVFDCKNP